MSFEDFNSLIQKKFDNIQSNCLLFRSSLKGEEVWDIYINSFKRGDDPVFRDPESSTHNCNNDKNFIRRYGNVVGINNNFEIVTMFDLDLDENNPYYNPCKKISNALLNSKISNVFFETFDELKYNVNYSKLNKNDTEFQLGNSPSYKKYTKEEVEKFGVVNEDEIYEFHHFNVKLKKDFLDTSGKSINTILHEYRDFKNVFERGLNDIPLDTLKLVKDLFIQNSLFNGEDYYKKLNKFIEYKTEFIEIDNSKKDNWLWVKSYNNIYAKFNSELIGVLCNDLAQGIDLNKACSDWNKRIDPKNFMKAKAPITEAQIKEANDFIEQHGYKESFNRRFARINDIDINEILHVNKSNQNKKEENKGFLFDKVKATKTNKGRHNKSEFDKIEEVSIEKFMNEILPNSTSIEVYFENRLKDNLLSLFTSDNKDSKKIFKWNNQFSWTGINNLTGKSLIKESVKSKGGLVDCALRFSIMWAEDDKTDNTDLDAWCILPDKSKIGYNTNYRKDKGNIRNYGGQLDVDIINPSDYSHKNIVENIAFDDINNMIDGDYLFYVDMFTDRNSKGFKAEIEFNGEIYNYEFNNSFSGNKKVVIVSLRNGEFSIKQHFLEEENQSRDYWNLKTNEFHKVNLMCLSPNYWSENNVGNKHYLFMLDGCKSDIPLRSFHNEYLKSDLLKYRKVLEVLGNTTMVEPSDDQLAGLGFNSTIRDELIVKIKGNFKRTLKIKI